MKLLDSINHRLIAEACNKALAFKTFKSRVFTFGVTALEYRAKLRSATITLTFSSIAGTDSYHKPKVTMVCKTNKSNELLAEYDSISNPLIAYDCANACWHQITITDKAQIGNLDDFECFDYLDYLFQCAHSIRSAELQTGKLCSYDSLDDVIFNLRQSLEVDFDREATKLDICKLVAEKEILSRFISAYDERATTIDDRIYLDARMLIESNYDGVARYKSRRY